MAGSFDQYLQGWYGLIPALVLIAYFAIGLVLFAIRQAVGRTRFHDPEVESRGSSVLVGMWLRLYLVWVTRPVFNLVRSTGVPATAVTTLSVILAFASAAAIAAGRFALGGWLYLASGFCDFLDGRLARASGTSSQAGAALDSVLDRYADSAVLVGLAWYFRHSWVLFAALVAIVGTLMVPYVRARGEGLGKTVKVGWMQRPERVVYLGISIAMSPVVEIIVNPESGGRGTMHLSIIGLLLVAVLTQLTTLQRLLHLLRELSVHPKAKPDDGITLIKYVVAALLATAADFAAVVAMVSIAHLQPWVATALGCVMGGAINYAINRAWTYGSESPVPQATRYTFVSMTSAALNAGGVAVLLLMPDVDYRFAWLLVRLTVFVAWNYPLQRNYVFGPEHPAKNVLGEGIDARRA